MSSKNKKCFFLGFKFMSQIGYIRGLHIGNSRLYGWATDTLLWAGGDAIGS